MIKNTRHSLSSLLGQAYINAVVEAQAFATARPVAKLQEIAEREIDFFPEAFAERAEWLAAMTGKHISNGLKKCNNGAPTAAFAKAQNSAMAPLGGLGCSRIGEDGNIYFIGKSEHYHASLGHQFPGYKLLQFAMDLGIPNATHNNTRGYITRLCEREIVRIANAMPRDAEEALDTLINSGNDRALNRIINLETGSLAVEAGLKMMLARFYRLDTSFSNSPHAGKTPVFLVMADYNGGCQANYHGTTILTQKLRGMWPEMPVSFKTVPVPINDCAAFDRLVAEYNHGDTAIAGFFHELVLMNYGGIRLTREFVVHTHQVCRKHDIPVMVDEIQSCMWCPQQFLFLDYGIQPDFVAVGKGFPGGQYPASRILTNQRMDSLNQFGALVTNGQEELASLAYLITMRFAEENATHISDISHYYHDGARKLALEFSEIIVKVEGWGLLAALVFEQPGKAADFSRRMNQSGIDVSAQTYKASCPPAALTKLPLISSETMIDMVLEKMRETLVHMREDGVCCVSA